MSIGIYWPRKSFLQDKIKYAWFISRISMVLPYYPVIRPDANVITWLNRYRCMLSHNLAVPIMGCLFRVSSCVCTQLSATSVYLHVCHMDITVATSCTQVSVRILLPEHQFTCQYKPLSRTILTIVSICPLPICFVNN